MKKNDINNEIEELNKKNKKYKLIIKILILIIIIGILGFLLLVSAYVLRHTGILSSISNGIVEFKYNMRINLEDLDEENIENVHNAEYRLDIESSYGDNQGVHPKVLNFNDKWNGYKYWMVYSPYPYSDDYRENPTIKVSNDKVNWITPEGLTNPLVEAPEDYINTVIYNSDPHLVYNNDTDTLECYYRYVNDEEKIVILYRLTSKDGINWSEKEEILKNDRTKVDYVSPAIIYDDGVYKMWYVNKSKVYYTESSDLKTFSKDKVIDIKYYNDKMILWHLDVIKTDVGYEMINVAMYNFNDRNRMSLYYTYSEDNEKWSECVSIIKPSNKGWDNSGLYRSSFIKEDGVYYVYYSGISTSNEKGISLSYGRDITNLRGVKSYESED